MSDSAGMCRRFFCAAAKAAVIRIDYRWPEGQRLHQNLDGLVWVTYISIRRTSPPNLPPETVNSSSCAVNSGLSGLRGGVDFDCAVGFVGGVAEGFEGTLSALWCSRDTDGASVMNDLV